MAQDQPITTTRRDAPSHLRDRLATRGWEFNFFQAVWLLEQMAEDCELVGGRGPASREVLRFRPDVGMSFPSTDVFAITPFMDSASGRTCYQIDVTFLGLYGVSTPLPLQYAIDILRAVDPIVQPVKPAAGPIDPDAPPVPGMAPARAFLDVLHHRVISLFYRAWLKYRYHLSYGLSGRDVITSYLLYLVGLSPNHTKEDLGVDPQRMIRYAGLCTQRPKNATAIEGLLLDYWKGVPVQVEQCVGRWVALKSDDMNRMGLGRCRLGVDLTVGEQVYDLCGQFRIVLGPVDWETYKAFLPDGERFAQTVALTRLYMQDPLGFTLEVVLKEDQVPPLQMASRGEVARLGYTSWLMTEPVPETSIEFPVAAAGGRRPGPPRAAPGGISASGSGGGQKPVAA